MTCRYRTLTDRKWAGCAAQCHAVECRNPKGVSGKYDYGEAMRNRIHYVMDESGNPRIDVREVREKFCGKGTCRLWEPERQQE